MKKSLLLLLVLIGGCGPKPVPETARTVFPVDLNVDVNDEAMTLSWKKSGNGPISGYNIYISEEPLVALYPGPAIDPKVETYNATPFPGDTNPDDGIEYFDATKLDNGIKYYVSVRVVYPDQSVSKPSNEVIAVCGPRGEIELAVRFQDGNDGFSFDRNEYVDADAVDNDLYFFSKDGVDYLASPKRLDGFINDTRFQVLPYKGEYADVSAEVTKMSPSLREDQVVVKKGDWVLLQCASKSYALVKVLEFSGRDADRSVKLFYAYSTLVGEIFF